MTDFYRCDDIDVKTQILSTELHTLLDNHAPEKVITVRDKRTPWLTNAIEQAIKTRDLAYSLYARNPNRRKGDPQWNDYQQKRSRAATLISSAKRRYGERHFDPDLPAQQLWNNLRREGVHNNSRKNSSCEDLPVDDMNEFFAEGHRQLGNHSNHPPAQAIQSGQHTTHAGSAGQGNEQFSFRSVSVREVTRYLFEIKSNAVGSDGIPISFLKMLSPFVLPLLEELFNKIIATQVFPRCWKKAIVHPIPKNSHPTGQKDFRPISVLPAASKILEKILLAQITDHLNSSEPPMLATNQSGYRKRHSTTTALTKVAHDVLVGFDAGQCTVMVLVDFSLAFNSVKHYLLRNKLRSEFGFSVGACNLMESFLGQRSQVVKMGDRVSGVRVLPDGTPQGSCLSSLLFSLYVNSLPTVLRCQYQLYADDLQIYTTGRTEDVHLLIQAINRDLQAIEQWAAQNGLCPNPKKTQAIVFSKEEFSPNADVVFCGETIQFSEVVTNLGLMMDTKLCWTQQVNAITAKVFNTVRVFRRFSPVLPVATRRKLVQAVVMPILTYGDVVFHPGLSAIQKEQLHRCFKAAIRFVHGLRRRDSTLGFRKTITGCDLQQYYRLRVCCFMRQGYFGQLPEYLQRHLRRGQMERARTFVTPRHASSAKRSVLVDGTSQWNSLPLAARSAPSATTFKEALKRISQ